MREKKSAKKTNMIYGVCASVLYLWIVSQVNLSGDVVDGANPLKIERKKQINMHTQRLFGTSWRPVWSKMADQWHQLWQMCQSHCEMCAMRKVCNEPWQQGLLFECYRWKCWWRWKEYLISSPTSSYSLLLSACRIIDLDAKEQCRDKMEYLSKCVHMYI